MVKKVKYLFFAIVCMCVTPLITHAECDYQRLAELSRLASNVQFNYVYNNNGEFTIYISNLTNDIYITDYYGRIINGGAERQVVHTAGFTAKFKIFSNDSRCLNEEIITKNISLPTFNPYSTYDECSQYPNFKYCQMWGDFSIDDEQFYQEFNQYVSQLNSITSAEEGGVNAWQTVLEILENNKFMFIIFGIFIGIFLLYLLIKKKRK